MIRRDFIGGILVAALLLVAGCGLGVQKSQTTHLTIRCISVNEGTVHYHDSTEWWVDGKMKLEFGNEVSADKQKPEPAR